jgi:hypothetical protein
MYILYFMNSATTNTVVLVNGSKRVEFVTEEGSGKTTKYWSIVKREMSTAKARREMDRCQAKGYRVVAAA